MSRHDSGIEKFPDIVGKRVGTQRGTDIDTIYQALAVINHVDLGKVKEVNVSYNLPLFLSGQVDVWPSYVTNEPYLAEKQGIKVNIISPRDNGLDFYGDTLFCTDEYAKRSPETIKRFLRATAKGWSGLAAEHPEETARICVDYDKQQRARARPPGQHDQAVQGADPSAGGEPPPDERQALDADPQGFEGPGAARQAMSRCRRFTPMNSSPIEASGCDPIEAAIMERMRGCARYQVGEYPYFVWPYKGIEPIEPRELDWLVERTGRVVAP